MIIVFLVIFLIADLIVLLASYFRGLRPEAALVCNFAEPLCQHPIPLIVLAVIAGGMIMLRS